MRESVPAYNIYNTLIYALVFALGIIYLIFPLIKRLDLDYDRKFFISLGPWVILGGVLASLETTGFIPSLMTKPPLIIPSIVTGTLTAIFAGKKIEEYRNTSCEKTVFSTGLVLSLIALSFHSIENLNAVGLSVYIVLAWIIPGLIALKALAPDYFSTEFILPVTMHYLDATSTVVSLRFGGYEQQLVARYFIDLFGPYGIFALKTLAIVPVVLILKMELEDKEKLFYLFVIAALGLGISVRNFLQVI